MRNVYANASCNIAAAVAADPEGGLFQGRKMSEVGPAQMKRGEDLEVVYQLRYFESAVTDAELHQRGWFVLPSTNNLCCYLGFHGLLLPNVLVEVSDPNSPLLDRPRYRHLQFQTSSLTIGVLQGIPGTSPFPKDSALHGEPDLL